MQRKKLTPYTIILFTLGMIFILFFGYDFCRDIYTVHSLNGRWTIAGKELPPPSLLRTPKEQQDTQFERLSYRYAALVIDASSKKFTVFSANGTQVGQYDFSLKRPNVLALAVAFRSHHFDTHYGSDRETFIPPATEIIPIDKAGWPIEYIYPLTVTKENAIAIQYTDPWLLYEKQSSDATLPTLQQTENITNSTAVSVNATTSAFSANATGSERAFPSQNTGAKGQESPLHPVLGSSTNATFSDTEPNTKSVEIVIPF